MMAGMEQGALRFVEVGMRIAIFSDLHGNAHALEAVLEAVADARIDQFVCLGDVATLGPQPEQVLQRLQDLDCVCILGNHDEFLLDPSRIEAYTRVPEIVAAIHWCRGLLSEGALDFVRSFKRRHEITEGANRVLFCHGSPRSNTEEFLPSLSTAAIQTLLAGESANIVVTGHTHLQMLRSFKGRLLLNPGSLGLPFLDHPDGGVPVIMPWAEYAVIDLEPTALNVSMRRIPLEPSTLFEQAKRVEFPLQGYLMSQYGHLASQEA